MHVLLIQLDFMSKQSDLRCICDWPEYNLWRKTFAQNIDSCFADKLYEIRVPKSSTNERSHSKFDQFREAAHTNLNKAEWQKKNKDEKIKN